MKRVEVRGRLWRIEMDKRERDQLVREEAHIREVAHELGLVVVSADYGKLAEEIITRYWDGITFKIERSGTVKVSLVDDPVDVSRSTLANVANLYVYTNPGVSGLVGPTMTILENLDWIYHILPGNGYVVGVFGSGDIVLDPSVVAEYDDIQGVLYVVEV